MVTSSRFVVDAQTYVVRNISSVKAEKEDAKATGPNVLIGIGILAPLLLSIGTGDAGFALVIGGLIMFSPLTIAGLFWRKKQKPIYSLILTSSAGEVTAVASKDVKMIANIQTALEQAIGCH